MSNSLQSHGLDSPWNSPGQNTGVGSLSLLQGIKLMFPALQVDSLPAEPPGKSKNTGVGSLPLLQQRPRNRTGVSCIAGGFFFFFFFFFLFVFYFIFKLNITVLDLPNIKMNPPQVYMCSPS